MRFATIASVFELPHARVLADALAVHHPGATLHVLTLGHTAATDEPFAVVSVDDLEVQGLDEILARHEREDAAQILQPHLLDHLLRSHGEPVLFLDAAHDVLGSLHPVAALLDRHPIVLLPRAPRQLPGDGQWPGPGDLEAAGLVDLGFVGVAPGKHAERFLEWWWSRNGALAPYLAGTRGAGNAEQGRRQLRRVLDLAPSLFAEALQIDEPGVELSPWNLHDRPLTRDGDTVLAGGAPLRSVALPGFRPDRAHLLGTHAPRVRPSEDPLLRGLLKDYAERLVARGWTDLSRSREVGARLHNGVVFTDRLAALYADALRTGTTFSDIFSPEGTAAFMAWLTEPVSPGAQAGISRYLHRVYRERADLPSAYPDLDGADGPGFAGWAWGFGRTEMDIPVEFLPPRPEWIDGVDLVENLTVDVAGYFRGTLGLGEAARLYVAALQAGGVNVHTTSVDVDLPADRRPAGVSADYGRVAFEDVHHAAPADVTLICVNADEMPRFATRVGESFFAGRRSIGVWAWETDVIPSRWDDAFQWVDEIWVYSRYIAEHLGRAAPVPVVAVPPPVSPPATIGDVPDLGLPQSFRFMFMFDFFSTVERKNPVAVIKAFKRAFKPGEGPHLVIKTLNAKFRPERHEELAWEAADHPDIFLIDRSLPAAEKNALLASCDCYVSLHRSEGYGLPLAECMAMGKPVIATAYSGNLDFMTPGNSYLVDYALTHVGAGVEIYPAEGTWAEPDIDHAAAQMRAVWEHQDEAHRRGDRARRDIATQLSPARVGAIARRRLDRLARTGTLPTVDGASETSLHEVERHLAYGFDARTSGAVGGLRRAVLRAMRPFTVPERELDAAVARALRELAEEVQAQRREIEDLRAGADGG